MIRLTMATGLTAELGDNLHWQSNDLLLEDYLEALYSPQKDPEGISPSHGIPGMKQAREASLDLEGTLEVIEDLEMEPSDGTIRVY